MHPQSTEPQTTEPQRQDWIFTFGSGQEHDGKYVVIPGTYDEARDEMLRHFGNRWSFQYGSAGAAGIAEFRLTLLPRSEWPEPAESAGAGPTQYRVEFVRIGRNHHVAPIEASASDADEIAEAVWRVARQHLNSRHFDVSVDLETGEGFIEAGRFGRFTVTAVGAQ